jgi:superfamily I DNA/RNA helicase
MLERNYRSTQTILSAANGVIANNARQIEKNLWTDAGDGVQIVRYTADNEQDEAAFVAEEVHRLEDSHGVPPGDCAVFYRTNAQSRVLEEILIRLGTPYQIIGGTRFYERKEIKDLLAYLQLLINPDDDVAAQRVINVPRRGIGAKTVEALELFAGRERSSFMEACRRVEENHQLAARASARSRSSSGSSTSCAPSSRRSSPSCAASSSSPGSGPATSPSSRASAPSRRSAGSRTSGARRRRRRLRASSSPARRCPSSSSASRSSPTPTTSPTRSPD